MSVVDKVCVGAILIICSLVLAENHTINVTFTENVDFTKIDVRVLQVIFKRNPKSKESLKLEKYFELVKYQSQNVSTNDKNVKSLSIKIDGLENICLNHTFQLRTNVHKDWKFWTKPFLFSEDSEMTRLNYSKTGFSLIENRGKTEARSMEYLVLSQAAADLQYYQLKRTEYFNVRVFVHDHNVTIKLLVVTGAQYYLFDGMEEDEKLEGLHDSKSFNFDFTKDLSFYDMINGTFGLIAYNSEETIIGWGAPYFYDDVMLSMIFEYQDGQFSLNQQIDLLTGFWPQKSNSKLPHSPVLNIESFPVKNAIMEAKNELKKRHYMQSPKTGLVHILEERFREMKNPDFKNDQGQHLSAKLTVEPSFKLWMEKEDSKKRDTEEKDSDYEPKSPKKMKLNEHE